MNRVLQKPWTLVLLCLVISGGMPARTNTALGQSQPQGWIVLNSGEAFHGLITRSAGPDNQLDYQVQTRKGIRHFQQSEVWVEAKSLSHAYRRMRDTFPHPTIEELASLAHWCHQHQLHEDKQQLLKLIKERQPTHSILYELSTAQKRSRSQGKSFVDSRVQMLKYEQWGEKQNLSGLSEKAGRHFTKEIHPILMNRCLKCHSDPASSFSLQRVSTNAVRQQPRVEQNLKALCAKVNWSNAGNSSLFAVLNDSNHQRVLGYQKQALQQNLQRFVARLVSEQKTLDESITSLGQQALTAETVIQKGDEPQEKENLTKVKDPFSAELFEQRFPRF